MKSPLMIVPIIILLSAGITQAVTINVPDDYNTIQDGINAASSGDTVLVENGTYVENIDFKGRNIVVGSLFLTTGDSAHIYSTIICGDTIPDEWGLYPDIEIAFHNYESSDAVIAGFTIIGGTISCSGSNPVIRDNFITKSRPAIKLQSSSPTITGNNITDNYGTGICCFSSNPTITGNTIINNIGGISCDYSSPLIKNNIIVKNKSGYVWEGPPPGGGINCYYSYPLIINNIVCFNEGGWYGGGVYCAASSPVIKNTIIWSNSALYDSAEIYHDTNYDEQVPIVTYCNIKGGWEGEGNISEHPLFINLGMNDFNLCSESPCIDAGDPEILDPDNSRSDIGIFFAEHPECLMGNRWYVSTAGDDVTGDGTEGNPFRTIQHAVDISLYGDTVIVGNGTYAENVEILFKNITLTSDYLFSGDTLDIINTVIEGVPSGDTNYFSNANAVVSFTMCDSLATLYGFTVTNGDYGGVLCLFSDPLISKNIIKANKSNYVGAGIKCIGRSRPYIYANIICENEAQEQCLYCYSYGGGIYCGDYTAPIICDNEITGNYAKNYGGGIYCGNYCNPVIINNIISNNESGNSGGGIYCISDSCTIIINGNIITGNTCRWLGGGLYFVGSNLIATNNIIAGNSAGSGGGVSYDNSMYGYSHVFVNNTIVNNEATYKGGGIYCDYWSQPEIKNTIIWGNIAPEGPEIYAANSLPVISYSNIMGDWDGEGNISANPLISGPDYNVCSQSPCINAGDPNLLDPDGTRSDIGYYFETHRECQFGNTWYVSMTGDDTLGDGSLINPFRTIQYAVDMSFSADTVIVDNGNYTENVIVNSKDILLASNYIFTGKLEDILNTVIDGDSASTALTMINCNSTACLSGFQIKNGSSLYGGGIRCSNSGLRISHNIISHNQADSGGGGIHCANSYPDIANTIIYKNFSPEGSAIYCRESTPLIENSILWNRSYSEIYGVDSLLSTITYSDIRGGWNGEGNINSDPLIIDSGFAICSQSPCIDAGNPALTDPDGTQCDIGIYFPNHPECDIGRTRYVSIAGNDITGDGSSANPYRTIQHTVDLSFGGDTVIVDDGTYVENIIMDMKNILLTSNYIFSDDTLDIKSTVIDGDSARSAVYILGCDSTSAIVGLTIRNGSVHGVHCSYSDPIIDHNIVTKNTNGISCSYSNPVIQYNSIKSNGTRELAGSGIGLYHSNPEISRNIITGNCGAGLYLRHSNPVITQNIITGNSGEHFNSSSGAGVYCIRSSATLINNTITGNRALDKGGGIYGCYYSTPTVKNCILWGNDARSDPQIHLNGGQVSYCNIQGFDGDESNIDVDPLFSGPQYNVCAQSPCLDAGDPDILDSDGSRSDIGVYFEEHPECDIGKCLYVSVDGSDETGDGTSQSPLKTIQCAIDNSFSMDTVIVTNGIYKENINFFSKNIRLTSNYVISSDTNDITGTVIDGDSTLSAVTIIGCDGSVSLTGFTIRNGHAKRGGGIYCSHSCAEISHNVISGNIADSYGGGVYFSNSRAIFENNEIDNNLALHGGGIYERDCDSNLIINKNIISRNTVEDMGGGMHLLTGDATISNNIIVSNSSASFGGGIYLASADATISGNIIVSNLSSSHGAGIYCNWASDPVISGSTICDNEAGEFGGGIFKESYVHSDSLGPQIINSILWGNSADSGRQLFGAVSATFSDIQGGWTGEGNIDSDPLFCNPEYLDYRLSEYSPCLGSGENGADMGALGIGCSSTEFTETDDIDLLPREYKLSQNYPNPFNPTTIIEYALPQACHVEINIYNILGQKVTTLIDQTQPAGWYNITWEGKDDYGRPVATGMYFYRVVAGDFIKSKKMLLLK